MAIKIIPKRFIHYVKKKQAFKTERIPEPQPTPIYGGRYYSYSSANPNRRKFECIICGTKSIYKAYFQMDGHQLVEKYCQVCLDKYVIFKSEPQIV